MDREGEDIIQIGRCTCKRDRQTERQRQTDSRQKIAGRQQTDRQIDTETDIQAEGQMNKRCMRGGYATRRE